jgi:hypothetical protein
MYIIKNTYMQLYQIMKPLALAQSPKSLSSCTHSCRGMESKAVFSDFH